MSAWGPSTISSCETLTAEDVFEDTFKDIVENDLVTSQPVEKLFNPPNLNENERVQLSLGNTLSNFDKNDYLQILESKLNRLMDKKTQASKLCASNIIESLQYRKENFFQQNISSLNTTDYQLTNGDKKRLSDDISRRFKPMQPIQADEVMHLLKTDLLSNADETSQFSE